MTKLTKKERDALPDSAFALPGRRFPIHDETHARAALSLAPRALKKKHITKAEYDIVVRKAHKVLEKSNDKTAKESFSFERSLWSMTLALEGFY